jgi:hypothetical protein
MLAISHGRSLKKIRDDSAKPRKHAAKIAARVHREKDRHFFKGWLFAAYVEIE